MPGAMLALPGKHVEAKKRLDDEMKDEQELSRSHAPLEGGAWHPVVRLLCKSTSWVVGQQFQIQVNLPLR